MNERLKNLEKIYENVNENMRLLINPLLQHAVDWESKIEFFKLELSHIDICSSNVKRYRFYSRELKEAEQQYINVMKVLISALKNNEIEQDDEFENFIKEYR